MTLRRLLLLSITALVLTGITATAVASTLWLRDYLYSRVDEQLASQGQALEPNLNVWWQRAEKDMGTGIPFPLGAVVEIHKDGRTIRLAPSPTAAYGTSDLILDTLGPSARPGESRSVDTERGAYRVLIIENGDIRGLVGLPLSAASQAIADIVRLQIAVAGVVLAAMAVIAWLIVRQGLRPLDVMVRTATVIATSPLSRLDLSRRVPSTALRSEAQRLAAALNGMLDHLQAAFTERRRSEERIRRFVADASHELRTPLTSVRGYAEMLRAGMLDGAAAEDALRRIHEEAERMTALVGDMLMLAALDAERPLSFSEVDLEESTRDAVADFLVAAPQQAVLTSTGPVIVRADRHALQQIIGNLLTNVRMHTPPEATVRVALERSEDGQSVSLTVEDDGPGLPPQAIERAFDRFFRVDADRSRERGGSGLGLAIVAALTAAHGGTANLDSEPGNGTKVTITLPCAPDSAAREVEPR